MTSPADRPIVIELIVRSHNPALLEGLDAWIRLGLVSDDWVRDLCQAELTCPLRETLPIPQADLSSQERSPSRSSDPLPVGRSNDFLPVEVPTVAPNPILRPPTFASRALQSFMAEISVLWLLFLGVFLVIASSGVLAATQWQNFSSLGQYGILLAYTLAFSLANLWVERQAALQLTGRMLKVATLLLIPVNFWMMDGFRLWSSGAGVGLAAIAALILSTITFLLLKPGSPWAIIAAAIGLSWLHWGWSGPGMAFLAIYVGTVGSAAVLVWQDNQAQQPAALATGASPEDREATATLPPATFSPGLGTITVAVSSLLLLARAILLAHVPLSQVGLALGVAGWLLCWLARREAARASWRWAGAVLLIVGWLIAVLVTPPWQAIAISGLGLWLLRDRLLQTGRTAYLIASFLVGLQAVWLLWRVVPATLQAQILSICTQLAGQQGMPFVLLGIGFFPYVVVTIAESIWWRGQRRPSLAHLAEQLALSLGIVLTLISLANPTVRSLNLGLSALTLGIVVGGRSSPGSWLIHLTHGVCLAAFFSGIDLAFPTLNANWWAALLLIIMLAEWAFLRISPAQASPWQRSAWHAGLILAAISYSLLGQGGLEPSFGLRYNPWSSLWLMVSAGLTGLVAGRSQLPWARLASWLSVAALVMVQPLLISSSSGRLLGLGVATGLMLINTRQLQHLVAAALTVGFGLGFIVAITHAVLGDRLTLDWLLVIMAALGLGLWLLQGWLLPKRTEMASLYHQATDSWAIAGTVSTLILLSLIQLAVYFSLGSSVWQHLLAAVLLLAATAYRLRCGFSSVGVYAIAWSGELALCATLSLTGGSLDALATANIALAFIIQLVALRWPGQALSVQLIPLWYAVLGALIQHRSFTATTGLYTLAVALVGISIGRQHPRLKPLTFLSLLGISLASYELLVYQLMQMRGDTGGDGMTLLAGLATGFAIAYLLAQRWLAAYLRLASWQLRLLGHTHWVLGNLWLLVALVSVLSRRGEWLWLCVTAVLAIYALGMGNSAWAVANGTTPSPSTATSPSTSTSPSIPFLFQPRLHFWTYVGITEGLVAIAYLLHLVLPETWLLDWSGAIAAGIAISLYFGPWPQWGWQKTPWRNAALLLPVIVLTLTAWTTSILSILIAAALYAWFSSLERRPRLSYISLLLANWAVMRWLIERGFQESLWYVAIISASLLYIAQIDPQFHAQNHREQRHWLRCLATGLVCLTGFYQAQVGIMGVTPVLAGFLAIALAFGFIIAGLLLQVRAFLYMGSATFIAQVLWQLWRFVSEYSFLLWIIGIALGLGLIWVAATFEARRAQISVVVQQWMSSLEGWQ